MLDLLIAGAGPAGMSAALEAAKHRIRPVVVDNRPEPGGNIYAYLESNLKNRPERMSIFGSDYAKGARLLSAFTGAVAAGRVEYLAKTRLWRMDGDGRFAVDGPRGPQSGQAARVIMATGAQERPMPLPGWTLPGVMGVGAAQILMKSGGELPAGGIAIVGAGPLPLLLAEQLSRTGRSVEAMIEPAGGSRLIAASSRLHGAMAAPGTVAKGALLLAQRRLRRVPVWRNATDIVITGIDRATGVALRSGRKRSVSAANVIIHDGIVPNLNPLTAAGLELEYSDQQKTWHARPNDLFQIAGDCAEILGVEAAIVSGRLAARRASGAEPSDQDSQAMRKRRAFRRFIDMAYPPLRTASAGGPETILCRCEAVTVKSVQIAVRRHGSDPNAIKRALRIGMGPCQGRMCMHSLTDFIASQTAVPAEAIAPLRGRDPILPVSFQTVAELEEL
ncbi:MAG: NAD(P)/FAD-dependent oxidoreductase [Pseudomonadota bacterium]